jgi:hypothetical protein
MSFTDQEILETVRMIELETLDIRTITLGINLLDCADPSIDSACEKIYAKIVHHAQNLVAVGNGIAADYGVPIVNKRIAVTPISLVAAASGARDLTPFARAMDATARSSTRFRRRSRKRSTSARPFPWRARAPVSTWTPCCASLTSCSRRRTRRRRTAASVARSSSASATRSRTIRSWPALTSASANPKPS